MVSLYLYTQPNRRRRMQDVQYGAILLVKYVITRPSMLNLVLFILLHIFKFVIKLVFYIVIILVIVFFFSEHLKVGRGPFSCCS